MYMHWRRKRGVSKGEYPLGSGFPIGASSIPVGTRFSEGKSSVLYLCFRPALERGWLRHLLCSQIAVDRHFSAAVGQADFVRSRTKSGFAPKGKSTCPEKEAEVYQSHRSNRECETFSVKLTTIRSFYDKINIIRRAFYYGKTKETGSQI